MLTQISTDLLRVSARHMPDGRATDRNAEMLRQLRRERAAAREAGEYAGRPVTDWVALLLGTAKLRFGPPQAR